MRESLHTIKDAAAGQERPELQKAIQEIVDAGFAGVQLRVHDERGEWVGSAGVRKLGGTAKPPTDGHFRIGSNTKTFVATLVLQLVAEGKVGLDAPADDYLPEFELDRRITVRMLLQHTSGVFNFTGEVYADGTIVPGIPIPSARARSAWTACSTPTGRRSWYGWRCPSRRGSRRERTGAIPTPTTYWPGC